MKTDETYDFVGHLIYPDVESVRLALFTEQSRTVYNVTLGTNEIHKNAQFTVDERRILEVIGYKVEPDTITFLKSKPRICDIRMHASFDKESKEILVAIIAKDNMELTDKVRKAKACIDIETGEKGKEDTFTKMELC